MNSLLTARRNGSSPTPTPTRPPSTATKATPPPTSTTLTTATTAMTKSTIPFYYLKFSDSIEKRCVSVNPWASSL